MLERFYRESITYSLIIRLKIKVLSPSRIRQNSHSVVFSAYCTETRLQTARLNSLYKEFAYIATGARIPEYAVKSTNVTLQPSIDTIPLSHSFQSSASESSLPYRVRDAVSGSYSTAGIG